jgi:type I restriction enzyme R subunit
VPPDEAQPNESGEGTATLEAGEVVPINVDIDTGDGGARPRKYYVADVEVFVVSERIQYYGKDGKLITESLRDYTRKAVTKSYASLDAFLKRWSQADRKRAVIQELEEQGVLFEPLAEKVGKAFGPFDLICHVAYGQPPLTRRERAENVKKRNYFAKYGETARQVLEGLLDKYADEGIENIEDMAVLRHQPINRHGTPVEIVNTFGGPEKFKEALQDLEAQIYQVA